MQFYQLQQWSRAQDALQEKVCMFTYIKTIIAILNGIKGYDKTSFSSAPILFMVVLSFGRLMVILEYHKIRNKNNKE